MINSVNIAGFANYSRLVELKDCDNLIDFSIGIPDDKEKLSYFHVSYFGKNPTDTAEKLKVLTDNRIVFISGSLVSNTVKTKEGKNQTFVTIRANTIDYDKKKCLPAILDASKLNNSLNLEQVAQAVRGVLAEKGL